MVRVEVLLFESLLNDIVVKAVRTWPQLRGLDGVGRVVGGRCDESLVRGAFRDLRERRVVVGGRGGRLIVMLYFLAKLGYFLLV